VRNASRALTFSAAVTIGVSGCVGGCAGPSAQPASTATAAPTAPATAVSTTVPVAGAITVAQSATAVDGLQSDLVRLLKPQTSAGVVGVSRRADGAPRVLLDVNQSFEVSSAQMRAETLLRIVDCAMAARTSGAFVVHVLGYGEPASSPDIESLAERRASSVASYLVANGVLASRVRNEGRITRDREAARRIELVFEPIIEGREVRAWMPPPKS